MPDSIFETYEKRLASEEFNEKFKLKEVENFLGEINFYERKIKEIMENIIDAMKENRDMKKIWTEEAPEWRKYLSKMNICATAMEVFHSEKLARYCSEKTIALERKVNKLHKRVEKHVNNQELYRIQDKDILKKLDFSIDGAKGACRLCPGNIHHLTECPIFKSFSPKKRIAYLKRESRCHLCLNIGHLGTNCKTSIKCAIEGCLKKHHYLMHRDQTHTASQNLSNLL